MTQLKQLIASHKSGDEVKMTMERLENGYKEKSITVTLAAQSDFVSESSPIIPMILRTHRIPVTPAIPETRKIPIIPATPVSSNWNLGGSNEIK